MKLRIIEDENRGHENVSSSTEKLLVEGRWYKIDYEGTNPETGFKFNNDVYVWAKNNNKISAGINQAKDMFTRAVNGYYTGRNGGQSFDRIVADKLNSYNANILNVTPQTKSFIPPYSAAILSKNDRDFRAEADKLVARGLQTYYDLLDDNDKFKQDLEPVLRYEKYYKHHVNEKERDNTLNNMMIIPYDSSNLSLAHVAHTFIHYTKDSVGNIHFTKDSIPIYDLRNKRKFVLEIKLLS